MSLSCDCGVDYDADWFHLVDDDFSVLVATRAKRCCSCKTMIEPGIEVVRIVRYRYANGDFEERIYGEDGEVCLAPWYFCEKCGGLYWAVEDLGMCCEIDQDIAQQIKEYNREVAR